MVRRGLSKEIVGKMIEMRKLGHSYREIMMRLGVSKFVCIKYLKDVPVDLAYSTQLWQDAEKGAVGVLKKSGFANILNLNRVCNAPFWDYYCTRGGETWLIDVTVNSQKNVADKIFRMVEGFKHAILYKGESGWKLVEISTSEISL